MKVNIRLIKKNRIYSEEFKREIVSLFEKGTYSTLQLEKLYGISNSSIYNWIYKFSTFNEPGQRVIEMKISSTQKVKDLEDRIRELERSVGQKQIKIDYLEKMIDLAKTELHIDIKKNFATPQSNGLDQTKKK
ncbi:transposase [Chryseobacterium sp. KCF3-3]|uniref:transposase n=1 Tax=Chryseobacterium sp. KCF3-3 TaxID=3231511 RepID=UPI00054D7C58